MRAFYFGGIRLLDEGQKWSSSPARGSEIVNVGVRRTYARPDPYSANFTRGLRVVCRHDLVTAYSDMNEADTLDAKLMQHEAALIAMSRSNADVSRVPDDTRNVAVTGNAATGPQAVPVGVPAGGWVPTPGRLVLFRNPTTGAGFVTSVTSYVANSLGASLALPVTNAWEVLDVVAVFPEAMFLRMEQGGISVDQRTDEWRPEIAYEFVTASDGVWAADHRVPVT